MVTCQGAGTIMVAVGATTILVCFCVLLRDAEFMAFGHWGFGKESNVEALRPADKKYFQRRHPRVWLSSPEAKDQQQHCTPRFRTPLPRSPVTACRHVLGLRVRVGNQDYQ